MLILDKVKLFAIAGLILIPVFFQFETGIFRDNTFIFESNFSLKKLPIPVSVVGLIAGLILLKKTRYAYKSLLVFSLTGIALFTALLCSGGFAIETNRLILIAQYLLPFLGLILGETYGLATQNKEFEKMCLFIVAFIVPLQLVCSWSQSDYVLNPYVYLFSIYQHLQYVPIIMVSAYVIAFSALWEKGFSWRISLKLLLPCIGIYVIASYSVSALICLVGSLILVMFIARPPLLSKKMAVGLLAIVVLAGTFYGLMTRTTVSAKMNQKTSGLSKESITSLFSPDLQTDSRKHDGPASNALLDRLKDWKFYGIGIFSNIKTFLFGHQTIPDRQKHRSAHNYYLDLTYNHGFLALIPLISLLIYTVLRIYRLRKNILDNPYLLVLVYVVLIIFLFDNSLKVGLRQPYPGIVSFFSWVSYRPNSKARF